MAHGTRLRHWLFTVLLLELPLLLWAQPEALRIPSPLLPAETEIVPFLELSLLQPSAAVFSSALDRSELLNMLVAKISTPLTAAEKQRLVQAFVDNGLALSTQMIYGAGWLRLASHTAIGVAVRERIAAYLHFNRFISELSFYGRFHPYFDSVAVIDGDTVGFSTRPHRFSELFAGTTLDFVWFREYTAGWGTIVLDDPGFRLSWGMNLKYVQGYAYLEGRVSQQQLRAFSAINPAFNIDYGKAVSPSLLDTNALIPIGWGLGADVGIQFQFPRLALKSQKSRERAIFSNGTGYGGCAPGCQRACMSVQPLPCHRQCVASACLLLPSRWAFR